MQTLSIDIETYSETSLKDAGTYRYTEDPAFTILLFAYKIDAGPVVCVDLTAEILPDEMVKAITDPDVKKTAYNAAFERICISKYLNVYLDPAQWYCTMVKGAFAGLPFGLDLVSKILGLPGKQKDGNALIKYFCTPCKPTGVNGGRTRNMPWHNPEKWQRFISYCIQDVVLESTIAGKLDFLDIPEKERQLWALDQEINDRGVLLDTQLIKRALQIDAVNEGALTLEAIQLTQLSNPNSGAQLKAWLGVDSLTKANVKDLIEAETCPVKKRVLQIRQELAKTSNKKWPAMLDCISADGRARGLIQYYGAGRTGRWAGRRIQPQNLPGIQLNDADLDTARRLVSAGDADSLETFYGNIPDTLSQLIRTAFIAEPGKLLYVSDLSSIEARITAWLAGEHWRLDIFKTHGKIYEASAAAMFKVKIEDVTKPLRQKGKIAELALGYQGGVNALITMGALNMGIPEDDLPELVYAWRAANKKIVAYWKIINDAALQAVRDGVKVTTQKGVTFEVKKGVLFIGLPSGRKLAYLRPKITQGKYGDVVSYEGVHTLTKQWVRMDSYGGKWVENIVQAIARDVLAEGMLRIDAAGYDIILTVHDEIVIEYGKKFPTTNSQQINFITYLMSAPIPWAPGLPLGADGFKNKYYKK